MIFLKPILSILPLSLLLPFQCFAQPTKKVTEKIDKYEKYEYYVLESDKKTKHGSWKKIGYKNELEESGHYKNGLKDSIWTEYYYDGKTERTTYYVNDKKHGLFEEYDRNGKVIYKGNYTNNEKTGIWELGASDNLNLKYDYDTDELLYFAPTYDLEYKTVENGDSVVKKLDKPCVYLEGLSGIYRHIGMTFKYTSEAVNKNIQGKIYITFKVGIDGIIKDPKIIKGLGYGMDEEALRCILTLPEKWSPAVLNGEKIETEYTIPVACRLN